MIVVHATLVALNFWLPARDLVDLDREQNLPTYFQSALLAAAALLSLEAMRLEARLLAGAGRGRGWTVLTWMGVAGLFGFLALDESLVIHERLNTDEVRAWFATNSPIQGTVVWLILLSPAVVAAVGGLVAWLATRARVSPRLCRWGSLGLALWLLSLVFEGTAKALFVPRNLYRLEVILEETAEAFGTTLLLCGISFYRAELRSRLGRTAVVPPLVVPWRRVIVVGALALGIPAAVVVSTLALNPQARQKSIGDDHLRLGRLDEAAEAYRKVVTLAPGWARAWDRLGIVEYRRGTLEAASRAFATAERLDPRDPAAPNHRGAVLFRQGRYAEAAEAFARAAALAPSDADLERNVGLALRRSGRAAEAEAALRRAQGLSPEPLRVVSYRVSVPAELPLPYLRHPAIEVALGHARAGRLDAALAEYRRVVAARPALAEAHLGLANELLRWRVADRLTRGPVSIRIEGTDIDPVSPSVRFSDWIRRPDGQWEEAEVLVEAAALPSGPAAGAREAETHYQRALALGAGAPARLGLALLAREEGRAGEAASDLGRAKSLDAGLPAPDAARAEATPARR